MDANKVQLGEPMHCLAVTYRNMGKVLHTGAEGTRRQLHHKSLPRMELRSRMPETWHTVSIQASQEAGECPFLVTVGFSLVQEALPAGVSSREIAWLLLPGCRSCLREAFYILFCWFTLPQEICSSSGTSWSYV